MSACDKNSTEWFAIYLNHTKHKSEHLAITSIATFNLETIRNNLAPSTKASKAYLNAFQSSFNAENIRGKTTRRHLVIHVREATSADRRVFSLGIFLPRLLAIYENDRKRPQTTANNRNRSQTTTNWSKSITSDSEQLQICGWSEDWESEEPVSDLKMDKHRTQIHWQFSF